MKTIIEFILDRVNGNRFGGNKTISTSKEDADFFLVQMKESMREPNALYRGGYIGGHLCGSWHGNTAWILLRDSNEVTFITGEYDPKTLKRIQNMFDHDDPKLQDKYGDNIMTVSIDEWDKQQD